VVALLVGVVSGTYSSIFNAAPLLVLWQEILEMRKKG
jgi:preprotein translocase subunit SecF